MSDTTTDVVDVADAAPVEAPAPEAAAPEAPADDVQARARAMGWRPKEEFRGNPEDWRDADEFVRRGEEELPVARERLRETTRKLSDLERRMQERDEEFARLQRMTQVSLNRQREQLLASYEAAQREAVRDADERRWEQLERDKAQAVYQFDAQATQQPQRPTHGPSPEQVPVVESWKAQNPWFLADPEMNQVAQYKHMELQRTRPDLDLERNLAEVSAYMRQRYADRLGVTAAPRTPAVQSGSRMASSSGPRAKGASELPAEARAAGEQFIKQGLFKDMSEYAREYWSQG